MNITIEDYSERAIAVFGDTKAIRDRLKNAGGMYNPSLRSITKIGGNEVESRKPGWTFSNTRKNEIQQLVKDVQQEVKNGTFVGCEPTPASTPSSKKSTPKSSDQNDMVARLLSEVELLRTEVANLKKIVLENKGNASSSTTARKVISMTIPSSKSWADEEEDDDEESGSQSEEEKAPRGGLLKQFRATSAQQKKK